MEMKNRKGSALMITMMVFVVLMILSSVILTLMVTNNKQAVAHRNKIQAYYIARSGAEVVEAAILNPKSDNLEKLIQGTNSINIGDEEANITLNEGENSLEIVSKGTVGKSTETVRKILEVEISGSGGNDIGDRGRGEDNFKYLGKFMPVVKNDGEYKIINKEKYVIINDDIEDVSKIKDGINYYIKGELDIELEQDVELNSNIYAEKEISIKVEGKNKNISISDSIIVSEKEIEISSESGHIKIDNAAIKSKEKIKIKIEKEDKNNNKNIDIINSTIVSEEEIEISNESGHIKIDNSVIKSKEKIKIKIEKEDNNNNKNIDIINTTIVSGINSGEVEISNESGHIKIDNAAIKSKEKIKIKIEKRDNNNNKNIDIINSTIVSEENDDDEGIKISNKSKSGSIKINNSAIKTKDKISKIEIDGYNMKKGAIISKNLNEIKGGFDKDFEPGLPGLNLGENNNSGIKYIESYYFKDDEND